VQVSVEFSGSSIIRVWVHRLPHPERTPSLCWSTCSRDSGTIGNRPRPDSTYWLVGRPETTTAAKGAAADNGVYG